MRVARSEGQLLNLAKGLLDGGAAPGLSSLLADPHPPIKRIGPTAARILERTLARGAVLMLCREGGWRTETRPTNYPDVKTGRLWERHSPPELRFSKASFTLLRRLLNTPLVTTTPSAGPPAEGHGDHILALATARAMARARLSRGLSMVASSPLVVLAHPQVPGNEVDWAAWVPQHIVLLEGLQDCLAEAWIENESRLLQLRDPEAVIERAHRSRRVLEGFLAALEGIQRLDLADFILSAAQVIFAPQRPLPCFDLDPATPLRVRTDATRSATAFADALLTLERAIHHERAQRFFDDGYDAAQARLARWERLGEAPISRARELREIWQA